jgi:NADH oxidase (H2O2-forming)
MPRDRIVLVGAGGAGLTAAFHVARRAPDTQLIVFSKDPVVAYSQCGMPFVLDGKIDGFDRLIIYGPEVFLDLGLDVKTSTLITDIDLDGKAVITGSGERVPYDRLVIATGSKPFVPPVPGADLPGVMALLTLEDGRRLCERMKNARNVVIIGGGPIGLETAPAFLDASAKLTIIERVPQLMPSALDPDMAAIVQERLEKRGTRVITGKGVDAINGNGTVESGYRYILSRKCFLRTVAVCHRYFKTRHVERLTHSICQPVGRACYGNALKIRHEFGHSRIQRCRLLIHLTLHRSVIVHHSLRRRDSGG